MREGCVFDLEHSNARRSASVRPSVRPLAVSAAAAAASRRLRLLLLLLHILRSPPTPRLARQVLYTIHAHPYNIVCCAFFNFFLWLLYFFPLLLFIIYIYIHLMYTRGTFSLWSLNVHNYTLLYTMIIYITRPFSVYNTYKRYDAIYILARDVQNDNVCVCVCSKTTHLYYTSTDCNSYIMCVILWLVSIARN